jgi:hypothetical protein
MINISDPLSTLDRVLQVPEGSEILDFSDNGQQMLIKEKDRVLLFDLNLWKPVCNIAIDGSLYEEMAVSPDWKTIALEFSDNSIFTYNLQNGRLISKLKGPH